MRKTAKKLSVSECEDGAAKAAVPVPAPASKVVPKATPKAAPKAAIDDANSPAQKSWYLYLIECQDGSYYAGITTDVQKRYATHMAGKGAKYTRARKPKRLLGARVYVNRSEAAKAEWAIKQLDRRDKPRFLLPADSI